MAVENPFNSTQDIRLEKNTVVTITKRTLRFSRNVYQTQNVTGFGEGKVEIGKIPWSTIIAIFIVGLVVGTFTTSLSLLLILIAISGVVWNFIKPKHYGLLLTLNSGDKALFITTDKPSLKKVINDIYEMMEAGGDTAYQISIQNSQVSGNFIQGSVGGDASYR